MRLIAELKMPGVGSWNGRWSGENNKYTIVFGNKTKKSEKHIGYYSYSWPDGWRASVTVREAKPREKVTNQFCGYEWMVDSIKRNGKILDD